MDIVRTKKDVIIITTSDATEAFKRQKLGFTVRKLKSRKDCWRFWIPKNYVGKF